MSEFQDRSARPAVPPRPSILARLSAAPHRSVPLVLLAVLALAGLTLLAVGARSPYTHANLGAGIDPGYVRTTPALVGEEVGLPAADARDAGADPIVRGAALYLRAGCAGCHALAGRGGVVGPRIAGIDADTVTQTVRQGPVGMPRFPATALREDDIADIAAYLRSLAEQ